MKRGGAPTAVLAQDAVELIAALGYSSAIVFGHDWGAVAAYGTAILAPERVTKLVTAAVPHGPGVLDAFITSYDQQRRSWYMFFFQTQFAEAAVPHEDFRFLERLWQDWSPGWTCRRSSSTAPVTGALVTSCYGAWRCLFPRGLRTEVITDAGHFVHQERPDAVTRVLLDFLRSG